MVTKCRSYIKRFCVRVDMNKTKKNPWQICKAVLQAVIQIHVCLRTLFLTPKLRNSKKVDFRLITLKLKQVQPTIYETLKHTAAKVPNDFLNFTPLPLLLRCICFIPSAGETYFHTYDSLGPCMCIIGEVGTPEHHHLLQRSFPLNCLP
jgi:hypothetical protein